MLRPDNWIDLWPNYLERPENQTEVEYILTEVFSPELMWPERFVLVDELIERLKEIGEMRLYQELTGKGSE